MLAAIKSTRFCGNYTDERCINRPTTFARTSGYLFPARRLECALPRNPCFPKRIFGNLRAPALVGKEPQGKVLTPVGGLRLRTPHPCRRHPVSRRCGSAKWFGRRVVTAWPSVKEW